jgi:hypothetical protein
MLQIWPQGGGLSNVLVPDYLKLDHVLNQQVAALLPLIKLLPNTQIHYSQKHHDVLLKGCLPA